MSENAAKDAKCDAAESKNPASFTTTEVMSNTSPGPNTELRHMWVKTAAKSREAWSGQSINKTESQTAWVKFETSRHYTVRWSVYYQ